MYNFLLAAGVYIGLFLLLYLSVKLGYLFGMQRRKDDKTTGNVYGVVKVAEGTVFALLGLLIAFTFSGAYDRFENRKLKIIEEINAIEEAYNSVDLLKPSFQPPMRNLIKQYADHRIETYKRIAEFTGFEQELHRVDDILNKVWLKAVATIKANNDETTSLLFIPYINNMLNIGKTRVLITRIHPPIPIFGLLIGLAALSAFLVGHGMAKDKKFNVLYTLCFVIITAFTLYVIIDLEFPRVGMIRVDQFDHLLSEMRNDLR